MAYDNTNSGALFVNEHKESADDADSSGFLNCGGKDCHFDSWLVVDNGTEQLDLRARAKRSANLSDGTGWMRRTDKQGRSANYPDWKGEFDWSDGTEYDIAGWRRTSKNRGVVFLAVKLTPKRKRRQAASRGKPKEGSSQDELVF